MSIVKGFIAIGALADNMPGVTAQFGELSPIASTFSKEKGIYTQSGVPLALISFKVADDNGDLIELPQGFANLILDISNRVYTLYSDDQMVDFADAEELSTWLATQYPEPEYSDIAAGELIVSGSDPNKKMPDFISCNLLLNGETFYAKFWFVDSAFRGQYDEFEIVVVPPVKPVDALNNTPAAVTSALNAVTHADIINWIEEAKDDKPPTMLVPHPLTWNNPGAGGGTLATQWTAIVYGPAGNNVDFINQAIVDYLENESGLPMSQWELIYPGLFSSTEFYLVPSWGRVAISEQDPANGIYSPTVMIADIFSDLVEFAYGYNEQYIRDNATTSNAVWKSVQFGSIGNVNNAGGNIRLDQMYPDYISVPTSSIDFNRMSQATQQFAIFLGEMFEVAEEATPTSTLPPGYTRSLKGDNVYVGYRLGDVNFLCLTKYSYVN